MKRCSSRAILSWKGGQVEVEFDQETVDITICGLPAQATISDQNVVVRLRDGKETRAFGCCDTAITMVSPKGGNITFRARLHLGKEAPKKNAHGEDRRCQRVSCRAR